MRKQEALATEAQHGGVAEKLGMGLVGESVTQQKIPIAMHEKNWSLAGCGGDQGDAFSLKAGRVVGGIVSYPNLKQVTQYEHSICCCTC